MNLPESSPVFNPALQATPSIEQATWTRAGVHPAYHGPMRPRLALALALALACSTAAKPPPPSNNPANLATVAAGWYRGDLHFHTNYSEDAKRQGGDDLVPALAIADAYRDPLFLARHPDWEGDGLDFVEVSDHRTDAALADPGFRHDHLIVVPGEEYGGDGHANVIGLARHIPQDPGDGETQDAHHVAAMAEAHAQGALFSVNHPCQDNRWPWDLEHVDGVEVWNGPWSAFYGESTLASLDAQVAASKAENPYIRAAIAHAGGGSNAQALWLWYGLLTRGHHPALLGGSDRHMLVPPALPTNYVRRPDDPAFASRQGRQLGADGLVAGMRAGATFVSSSPHGPQILLEAVDAAGRSHPLGSTLSAGATYTIRWTATRAQGGRVRLVGGAVEAGAGPVAPAPRTLADVALTEEVAKGEFSWATPATGAWLHAVVLAPRVVGPLPPELDAVKGLFDQLPTGKGLGDMVTVMGALVDPNVLFAPKSCDPSRWEDGRGQCMPADRDTWATFYLPEPVIRLMNSWFEDGRPTAYTLGALSSAFLAR